MDRLAALAYFMLPAYLANMTPPFVRFWTGWNRPISSRWLGNHKTILGLSAGLFFAFVTTFLQARTAGVEPLWPRNEWPIVGLSFGLGAMGGDCVKSFLKRLRGVAPGRPWMPMDQLDFVVGALLLTLPWVYLQWRDIAIILIVSLIGDILVNQLAFKLRIRTTPR
jgi:CDP-2,3-bis-(O-geranylgeranyl)-sn-glycerol synthase